jgi:tRNA(Ile)-lysidine synthase
MTLEGRFTAALDDIFSDGRPRRLALAVSGGGDSTALMHFAVDWSRERGVALNAVTVDHGLRPESVCEARMVAAAADALGVPHTTVAWSGWDRSGNLQDAARRARRELIEEWARDLNVDAILTGHTMDDQAETVLMRLARGSGVDGLAGMARLQRWAELWARPLLGVRRAELRSWLEMRGVSWAEDPSNEDLRFDRVKARRLLCELSPLGLTVERLDNTSRHMRQAQEVLHEAARELAARAVTTQRGDVLIELHALGEAAMETRTRLIAAALQWVSGAEYRPRYTALERLATSTAPAVLHGCHVSCLGGRMRVTRELAAVRGHTAPTDSVWDGRWHLEGPHAPDLEIRALTRDGLARCARWRETDIPAESLQASPSIWRGRELVAAPLAGMANGWMPKLLSGRDEFSMDPITR